VGIDRLYEDDAPDVAHDSPTAEGDVPTAEGEASATVEHDDCADSDAERTAFNLKYRADVEAVYQAAWDEALPTFEAAREEHRRRFPQPERSRPTVEDDGSWHCDGGRLKLSSARNADVDRGGERIREIGKNSIIPGMRSIEAEDTTRHLVGFEHRFKEDDRLKEKVAERLRSKPGRTTAEILDGIPDAIRFTFQYPHESYIVGVRRDIERLEAHGFIQVERRNTWTSDQYKGINSRWREPESDQQFEVQFHTRISYEAKELTHKAYERIRSSAEDPERAELKEFQRSVCAMVPLPPGVAEYEDFLRKERDG